MSVRFEEQRYLGDIPVSKPKPLKEGEARTLFIGTSVTPYGEPVPEGRDLKYLGGDQVKIGFVHGGNEGKFVAQGDEVNNPALNLRTTPNRLGIYTRFRLSSEK